MEEILPADPGPLIFLQIFDVGSICTSIRPRLSALHLHPTSPDLFLVATRGGDVFETLRSTGGMAESGVLLSGHFSGDLTGVTTHPFKKLFATSCDDGTLRVWSAVSNSAGMLSCLCESCLPICLYARD